MIARSVRGLPVVVLLLLTGLVFLTLAGCQSSNVEPAVVGYLLAESDLPEYERHLDHAGLMSNWTEEFYHKGMVTYRTQCYSCHGDTEQPGSIPNSRQFWSEAFKNGADPHAMYQTLTRGFGMMPPQVRLTPREKYEVIHFIREEFIKDKNPEQYFEITEDWLAGLPVGDTQGPDPQPYKPWAEMDYGNFLMRTYDLADAGDPPKNINRNCCPIPDEDFRDLNFAYKGIAMRLDDGDGGVAAGSAFALFDHDLLRFAGFWTGEGFIDFEDILLDDQHNVFPRTVGDVQVENPVAPGWANPQTGSFEDPRFVAVDGRPFGPLPKEWAHYRGLYYHGDRVVIKYTVGDAEVLETYDLERGGEAPVISRTLNIGASSKPLRMRIAPEPVDMAIIGEGAGSVVEDGYHVLEVPVGEEVKLRIFLAKDGATTQQQMISLAQAAQDLSKYTQGGPTHDPQEITSPIIRGDESDAYAVDVFALPLENPWKARMRPTGIDFLDDPDEAVVSTIDGEVYHLKGLTQTEGVVTWRRIATGLFQPLGIKYHEEKIYVSCRDQIAVLHDLNGDGETDFYESFNSDHQVTEHFHEFAMGLQVDEAGNFYYAKSGRHARKSLIPQHGTLIRVSPDGSTSEIIASGFRAANGVALNPDGSFIVTDQEGFWNPMNRINWVEEGGFYGNMWGYGAPDDTSNEAMEKPLAWVDKGFDRSPSELLWIDSKSWGPLHGKLVNLSYGHGRLEIAPYETVNGQMQGGLCRFPIPDFPTGTMRGRFNQTDGHLYLAGMSAWGTAQMHLPGGFFRVRATGKPSYLPVQMNAYESGIDITFSEPLSKESVNDIEEKVEVESWSLLRSADYGSKHYDEKAHAVEGARLTNGGKTLRLSIDDMSPVWQMSIQYKLEGENGEPVEGEIQNTIHNLGQETNWN